MHDDGVIAGKKDKKKPRARAVYIKLSLHNALAKKCEREGRKMGTTVQALVQRWIDGTISL